jgi:DNA-binding CsgD family transcriptional regulator
MKVFNRRDSAPIPLLTLFFTLYLLLMGITPIAGSTPLTDGILDLNNGWEYRWGETAAASDMGSGRWSPLESFPGQPPGRNGNRHLLLRVKLPEIPQHEPVLFIKSIHSLFELYIDQQKVYSFGDPGNPGKMPMDGLRAHFIPLESEFSDSYAYFHLYSKVYFIGIQSEVLIGSRSALLLRLLRTELDEVVIAAVFICAGLFSFFISLRVKGTKAFSYFGFSVILLGLYTFRYTVLKQFILNVPVFWLYVWMVAIYLLPLGLLGLFIHIFGPGRKGLVGVLFKINLCYAALFSTVILADVFVRQFSAGGDLIKPVLLLRFALQGLIIIDFLVLGLHAVGHLKIGDPNARVFLGGLTVLAGFSFHNILAVFGINMLNFTSRIHWGMLGFTIALIIILVNHFREVQETLIRVKEELGLSKRIQQWILDEPVLLLDKDRKIIMTNLRTEELIGMEREELASLHYSEIIDEYIDLSEEIEKLTRGSGKSISCRFHFKNAEKILIDAKISKVVDRNAGEENILIRGIELKGADNLKDRFHITKRETEIIEYILLGFTNRLIASELDIAERTVKSHITSIYGKLEVSNKVQLMNKLKDDNLIPGYTADRVVLLRAN